MLMDNLVEPVLPSTFKLVAEIVSLSERSTSTMSTSPALENAEFCIGVLCDMQTWQLLQQWQKHSCFMSLSYPSLGIKWLPQV